MIRSLIPFLKANDHLYVFCFDDKTFEVLGSLQLPHVVPISLKEFETTELLKIKPGRTKGEYCWTCTPHVLLHVLEKRNETECTYLDADLYFYQDPAGSLPKSGKSVLITEHRYTPRYDQTKDSGIFCVQFVYFKKTTEAMKLLHLWGQQCLDWCYNRVEDGKFGDQKYLDQWPSHGDFVQISDDRFVGVAPWNIQQYSPEDFKPVFFHFHGIQWYEENKFFVGGYSTQDWAIQKLYRPYLEKLSKEAANLKSQYDIKLPVVSSGPTSLKKIVKRIVFNNRYIELTP